MVKIGAELPKISPKIKLGIRFLDHPVCAPTSVEIDGGFGWFDRSQENGDLPQNTRVKTVGGHTLTLPSEEKAAG